MSTLDGSQEGGKSEDALFDAIRKNDLDTAVHLIKHTDVDVNKVNSRHKTMLSIAVEREHVPMVELLVKNGANINAASFSSAGYLFETPIAAAARLGNGELVDYLVSCHCELDKVQGKEAKSAFQWAAQNGDFGMMKLLHRAGADINFIGPYLHTALHYATISEKKDVVEWLLENGAKVTENGERRTPLHIASVKGNFEIVKLLMQTQCVADNYDSFGFTPFSLSCLRGHLDIVKYMFENAPKGTVFSINDALHRASECGHLEVLEFLIHKGADVNSLNRDGESALSICARGQPLSVQLLVENGAIINVVDKRGYTPLQHAILREQSSVATFLIEHGSHVDTYSPLIDSPIRSSYNISDPVLMRFLISAGCNLSCENWLNPEAIKTKLRELDFQYNPNRIIIDLKRDSWRWILEEKGQPNSLLGTTRIAIRRQISKATGGRSILSSLYKLPLPHSLKSYIALKDEI